MVEGSPSVSSADVSKYDLFSSYRAMLRRARLCDTTSTVRPSVTFRYRDHIGWNTSKIIS